MNEFWRGPVRMIQPNLRMVDAKGLDGRRLVREVRSYGANAILANAGGIVAWYPTDLPYHWRNPLLKRDFVGEVAEETRKLGMGVLFRMDWSCLQPRIARKHPDWLALDADGKPIWEWKGTRNPLMCTCPSRPYWQEYGPRELEELVTRYPIDGFFFNAWNLPDCRCPECQRACWEALGERIPRKVDWSSEFGHAFLLWRCAKHAAFTGELNRRIKRSSPSTLLTVDYHLTNDHAMLGRAGWDATMLTEAVDMVTVEAFNFLDRPHPQWGFWASEEAMMINTFAQGKPGLVLLTGSERWLGRRPAQPPAQLALNILQVMRHGANPCVALSGDFRQEDRKCLPVIRRVYRGLEREAGKPAPARRAPRAALVYPQRTLDLAGDDPRGTALLEYRGWYQALTESRADFTVVHDGSLEAFLRSRPGLRTLVLPNASCLGDGACRAVDGWVRDGGKLIATFEASRRDGRGRLRRGFGLACLRGRPGESLRFGGTWFEVDRAGRKWVGRHADIFPVAGDFLLVRGGRGGSLPLLGWKYNNKPEWSEPERRAGQWGVREARAGKGKALHLPWMPGKLYHLCRSPEHLALMARLATL